MPAADIVFVFPKIDNGTVFRGFDYHLGAGYVRAFLETKSYITDQFISYSRLTPTEAARAILDLGSDVVGFSCYDSNLYLSALISQAIKEVSPRTTIIIGGPTATFSAKKVLSYYEQFDIAVRSYGEESTAEILTALHCRQPLNNINGITWRAQKTIIENPDRTDSPTFSEVISLSKRTQYPLDRFPDPYSSRLIPYERVADLGVITSRGCPFPCTFCNFAAISGRKVREHSVDYVLSFLDKISSWHFKNNPSSRLRVAINDDNFSTNAPRMRKLLGKIRDRGYENVHFWAEMRVDNLEANDFLLMSESGFSEFNIGLDSASLPVIRAAKKIPDRPSASDDYFRETHYIEQIRRAVTWSKQYGITPCVSIILGLPKETPTDAKATLDFVTSLALTKYAHNYLQIFDGTSLAAEHQQFAIDRFPYPGRPLPWITLPAYRTFDQPILPGDESQLPYRGQICTGTVALLSGILFSNSSPIPSAKSYGRGPNSQFKQKEQTNGTVLALLSGCSVRPNANKVLSSILPLNTVAWIAHKNPALKDGLRCRASMGLPLQDLNFLHYNRGSGQGFTLSVNCPTSRFGGGPVAQFRKFDNLAETKAQPSYSTTKGTHEPKRYELREIRSKKDIISLLAEFSVDHQANHWVFSKERLSSPLILLDSCRWSTSPCPSPTMERIFLDDGRTLRPCIEHEGIPLIAISSLKDAARELERQNLAAELRRDCKVCPAKSMCSRCSVLPFQTERDFCDVIRETPNFSLLIGAIDGVRRLIEMGTFDPDHDLEVWTLASIQNGGTVRNGPDVFRIQDMILFSQTTTNTSILLLPFSSHAFHLNKSGADGLIALLATKQEAPSLPIC